MTRSTNSQSLIRNRILAALPAQEYERLLPALDHVETALGEVLAEPDTPIRHVYFPERGTISLISVMENGAETEVGLIGNEGMFGLPLILGTGRMPMRAVVQIADGAMRMKASFIAEEVSRCSLLYRLLLSYSQALFVQTAQTAACNRQHPLEGRLARWLLMSQDRARADEMQMTHEFLAIMLGVRRSGVTIAAGKLQSDGIIEYMRGRVQVLDRAKLEMASCECYRVVRAEFTRLLL